MRKRYLILYSFTLLIDKASQKEIIRSQRRKTQTRVLCMPGLGFNLSNLLVGPPKTIVQSLKKRKRKGTDAVEDSLDGDLALIQDGLTNRTETISNDTRDLVHSD